MTKLIKFVGGSLMLVSFCLGLGCQKPASVSQPAQAGSPSAVPHPPLAPGGPQPPAQAALPPNPEDQMRRTRAEEAIQLVRTGDALIIDVRGTETFKTQHIKGAIDYSLERIEKGDIQGLPRNKLIIAYCA